MVAWAPRSSVRRSLLWRAAILGLLILVLSGCRAGVSTPLPTRTPGTGLPRPFEMGLSSVPPEPSDEAYRGAFAFAGRAGEVVLIQRAPPWAEFLPGAMISERTERLTRLERDLARTHNLKLFLVLDPTDPGDRGRLAALPDELRGHDFSDPRIRAAFIAYAKYLALNYKPAYLALGAEVDMFFNRRGDAAFRNFQSLYFEAYDAVKAISPSTLVFPTFQYEDLQAILKTGESTLPSWSLIARFEPKIDMLAVSSFPGFVYKSADEVPSDYYRQLRGRFQKPIALVSVGWSSAPQEGARLGGETDQAAFLRKALSEAEDISARVFIWYLGRDLTLGPSAGFEALAATGLFAADGSSKSAWRTWRFYADRPVAAATP